MMHVTPAVVPFPSGEVRINARRFPVMVSVIPSHTLRNTADVRAALDNAPFVQHHHRGARANLAFD